MTTPAETSNTTTTSTTANIPAPSVNYTMPAQFTSDDIEKARAEERDKLYSRISRTDQKFKTLEEELKSIKDARDADLAKEREAREAAEAEAKRVLEDEMSARQLIESGIKNGKTSLTCCNGSRQNGKQYLRRKGNTQGSRHTSSEESMKSGTRLLKSWLTILASMSATKKKPKHQSRKLMPSRHRSGKT